MLMGIHVKRRVVLPLFAWGLLFFASLLLTSCATETLRREIALPHRWGTKVPVLMYHRIVPDSYWTTVPESRRPEHFRKAGIGDGADPYLYLRSQSLFEREMAHLAQQGYTTISLYELREYILSKNPALLPPKPVVITFDDGSTDWFDIAYPILSRHNFKATFFVITNDNVRGKFATGNAPLSWEQVRQMALHKDASGKTLFDIESHTHNHISLADVATQRNASPGPEGDLTALRHELEESMKILEQRVGKKPAFLALPYGAGGYDIPPHTQAFPIIKSVAQGLGYLGIRTSRQDIPNDLSTDVYLIGSQVIVFSSTTLDEYRERLSRFAPSPP
jgi:peptidoglycan/xylan/chitin deacetylase (PgdA/CDA1 family)